MKDDGGNDRDLTHLDGEGRARMVDVGGKPATRRTARAGGRVTMAPATVRLLAARALPKGDVLAVARVAGIMAAKETARLIPLRHPLNIENVAIDFEIDPDAGAVGIEAAVSLTGKTGVEMEALTAVTVAALTVYDMCKAVDKGMAIGEIRVVKGGAIRDGDEISVEPEGARHQGRPAGTRRRGISGDETIEEE